MLPKRISLPFVLLVVFISHGSTAMAAPRWSVAQRPRWYAPSVGFWSGANFVPSTAINQLEMWQAETFDPKTIDLELGWAAALGMNTMRVFLHDCSGSRTPQGFLERIDQFLTIAAKHHIRPCSCCSIRCGIPFPQLGQQRAPSPGVHNSGWVQSPGQGDACRIPHTVRGCEAYVTGVVGRFENDPRVLAWDIWNEPDNTNEPRYWRLEPKNKSRARACAAAARRSPGPARLRPTQPLTSGLWKAATGRRAN